MVPLPLDGEIASTGFGVIRANQSRALPEYLFAVVSDQRFVDTANSLTTGASYPAITENQLFDLEIPLPPIDEQRRIVAQIEGFRDVIVGAHQILSGYKPSVEFNTNLEKIRLGEACECIMDGTHFSPKNSAVGEFRYITAKNIKEMRLELQGVTYITKAAHDEIYRRCPVQKGDVLYIKDGATTGVAAVNPLDEPFSLLSSVAVLRGKSEMLNNRFLAYYLNSPQGRTYMLGMIAGVAITRLTLEKLNDAEIPLPSLEEQHRIVAELDAEAAQMEAVRALIPRFEAKIQHVLDCVWGNNGAE